MPAHMEQMPAQGQRMPMQRRCSKKSHVLKSRVYKECIRNIHKYLWYKMIRKLTETQAPPSAAPLWGGRPIGSMFLSTFWSSYIIDTYGYSLYIPNIFHIYFLAMWSMFSLVCSLIYGVKRTSGHDRSQSFGPIWHVAGPEIVFWPNDIMILHHFCWRSSKIKLF